MIGHDLFDGCLMEPLQNNGHKLKQAAAVSVDNSAGSTILG
ncbi:MAG: hypothetical protein GQF41_1078 [Candidatus Rifleibacterium amylolyticum]|nr:MAG: hypothetical protein GQF41_1078 [Candidatus Rifleibacterium amylolyticum]